MNGGRLARAQSSLVMSMIADSPATNTGGAVVNTTVKGAETVAKNGRDQLIRLRRVFLFFSVRAVSSLCVVFCSPLGRNSVSEMFREIASLRSLIIMISGASAQVYRAREQQ